MIGDAVTSLSDRICREIERCGPLPFSVFQALALYDQESGFYSRDTSAGRNGDFVTSPEIGLLFGRLVARVLDQWWNELGCPDPFVVVECGAGSGSLARAVIGSNPSCAATLHYLLVEQSPPRRQLHRSLVDPGVSASIPGDKRSLREPVHVAESGWDLRCPELDGQTPVVTSVPSFADLPEGVEAAVVLANELLDNLPIDMYQRQNRVWYECLVDRSLPSNPNSFTESLKPLNASSDWGLIERLDELLDERVDPATEVRVPLQSSARSWLESAISLCPRGKVICFDYFRSTHEMALLPMHHWLRTYRGHGPGGSPFVDPGSKDITCDVALDQLTKTAVPATVVSQRDFLRSAGLDRLVAAARVEWTERAAIGDLAALEARSLLSEAEALADPAGLGGHKVVEWTARALPLTPE